MSVQGIARVRRNIAATMEDIAGRRTHAAVFAILSQGGQVAGTLTPVDTSNLVNSQYLPRINRAAGKTTGTVGYTAEYAAAVHDAPGILAGLPRPGNRGNYWDPGAEPRFLEKGFDIVRPQIPSILRRAYAVGR